MSKLPERTTPSGDGTLHYFGMHQHFLQDSVSHQECRPSSATTTYRGRQAMIVELTDGTDVNRLFSNAGVGGCMAAATECFG